LFSQHSGHSTCGRPCRPCSCSHAKYAPPATSTKLRPPPKGRPGALGMRGGIAVHLSIDTAARSGDRREPAPSCVTPAGRIDCKARRRCPCRPMWPASLTAPGSGHLAPRRRSALVTPCCRSWSLITRGIRRSGRVVVAGFPYWWPCVTGSSVLASAVAGLVFGSLPGTTHCQYQVSPVLRSYASGMAASHRPRSPCHAYQLV
jgi:hypothetical protein